MLLELGKEYREGTPVDGVVLNDIGTLYQEGVGVFPDGYQAEFWFKEAVRQGDLTYASANLGDLYRKGCGTLPVSLPLIVIRPTLMLSIASDRGTRKVGQECRIYTWPCSGIRRQLKPGIIWLSNGLLASDFSALEKRPCV